MVFTPHKNQYMYSTVVKTYSKITPPPKKYNRKTKIGYDCKICTADVNNGTVSAVLLCTIKAKVGTKSVP